MVISISTSDAASGDSVAAGKLTLKCITAQITAALIGSLLTMNVSSMLAMITLVIGELKEKIGDTESLHNSTNSSLISETRDFIISNNEASLYATLQLLSNLSASIVVGILQDKIGRKKCLMISFVFHILSWVVLRFTVNVYWLYSHAFMVGLGTAFSESVVITYISEISITNMRGRMFAVGKFGYGVGSFLTFFLSNFYSWRELTSALLILPWILPLYMAWLPESPLWLLSKGREKECKRSLKWLRGWTSDQDIEVEFQRLRWQADEKAALLQDEEKQENYFTLFAKPEFFEPFKISMVLFFSSFLLSLRPARFYFINTLNDMGISADSKRIMTVTGLAGILGCICLALTVQKVGKRALTLWTFTATGVCLLLMGAYSWMHFKYNFNAIWMIYVLCTIIYVFGGYTLGGMPWFITSEIFPQRYRGLCGSIIGMFAHGQIAVLTETYLYIEELISVSNVFFLYSVLSLICCYYLYKILPETENKSLYEVEEYFKNKHKKKDVCLEKHSVNTDHE